MDESLSVLVGRPLLGPVIHFLVYEGVGQFDQVGDRGGEGDKASVVGFMNSSFHCEEHDQTEGCMLV